MSNINTYTVVLSCWGFSVGQDYPKLKRSTSNCIIIELQGTSTWMSRSKLVARISWVMSPQYIPFIGRWRNPLIPALPTTGHPGHREKLCEIFSSELAGVFVPFWRKSFGRWGDSFTSIASVASWQANWFLVKLRDEMGTNVFVGSIIFNLGEACTAEWSCLQKMDRKLILSAGLRQFLGGGMMKAVIFSPVIFQHSLGFVTSAPWFKGL